MMGRGLLQGRKGPLAGGGWVVGEENDTVVERVFFAYTTTILVEYG
jgi:hypothetical protein